MSGGEIAAVIGALATFIGTIGTTWKVARSDRVKTRSEGAAVLLSGWENFQMRLLGEIERVQRDCEKKIGEVKAEHALDRQEFERREQECLRREEAMQVEINQLRAQITILIRKAANDEG